MTLQPKTLEAIRSAKESLEMILQCQPLAEAALKLLEKEEDMLLQQKVSTNGFVPSRVS